MTIKECIDIVEANKPNQYTIKDKVTWLSFIEGIIINEVLKTHEGYDARYDDFNGYSEDKLSVTLIVPSPYDRLYTAYLTMMIDQKNNEISRYNNSRELYNSYLMEYRKYYHKTHMPIDFSSQRQVAKPSNNLSVTEAQLESLKRELTYILTEFFASNVSPDKIQEAVTQWVSTNIEMLKGKPGEKGEPGYTPQINIDYWTKEDVAEIHKYIDNQTAGFQSDIDGIRDDMYTESHFRGYVSTNAELNDIAGTPNDFVYSAESGTQWVCNGRQEWINTGIPVPDQLTPASNTTPLINGTASKGTENAYARGDHRHPTDTTRASVQLVNGLIDRVGDLEYLVDFLDQAMPDKADLMYVDEKLGDIDSALDELHNYAQALIGGAS